MAYDLVSEDGLARSNDGGFIALWNDIGRKQASERRAWVAEMVERGAKIITADDGWVNRERHTVCPPSYADMHRTIDAGDLIALGGPDKWRIVRCTGYTVGWLSDARTYSFDAEAVAHG